MDLNNDLLAVINTVDGAMKPPAPEITSEVKPETLSQESTNSKEELLSKLLLLDLNKPLNEVLSELTLADFSKSLNEVLIKLTQTEAIAPQVNIPWDVEEEGDLLKVKLSYQFPTTKLNYVLEQLVAVEEYSLSFEVNHADKENLAITVKGEMSKETFEQNKDILGDKVYTNILNEIQIKEVFDDVSTNDTMLLDYSTLDRLPMSTYQSEKQYVIKVPIAKKGSFHHPVYGVLDYSDEVLSIIEENINNDVLGYPIPITFGHGDDGAFKKGELIKAYREGEVLFGEWEVKPEAYKAVQAGDINFSSAEFFRDYMDKKTGKTIGRALYGMALTNKPYIPNQPRVEALSDEANAQSCYFLSQVTSEELQYNSREVLTTNCSELEGTTDYSNEEEKMPENKEQDQELLSAEQIKLSNELQVLREQLSDYHTKLTTVEAVYQEKLTVQESLNQQLQDRIQKYEDRIKEEEVNAKLSYLKELQLPAGVTEKYSELIKTGALGESEEVVLSSLADIAKVNNSQLLTQHGVSNATANMNDETYADPYAKVIEYNKKIVEAKKVNTLAALQS